MHRIELVTNAFGQQFRRERGPHGRICCADCHQPLTWGTGIAYMDRIIGDCCFSRYLSEMAHERNLPHAEDTCHICRSAA